MYSLTKTWWLTPYCFSRRYHSYSKKRKSVLHNISLITIYHLAYGPEFRFQYVGIFIDDRIFRGSVVFLSFIKYPAGQLFSTDFVKYFTNILMEDSKVSGMFRSLDCLSENFILY